MTEIAPKTMRFRVTDQNGQDITDQVTITAVELAPDPFGIGVLAGVHCPVCKKCYPAPGNVLPTHGPPNAIGLCPGSGVQIEGAGK